MPRPKRQSDEIVLDTALQVILDKGPASFTLTDVAVAVGLSRAALIQRFTDKATLHRKVMERMTQAVRNYFAELSPEPGLDPLWSMLKDLIAGMGGGGGTERYLILLLADLSEPTLHDLAAERNRLVVQAIERRLPASPHDPARAARAARAASLVQTVIQGSCMQWLVEPQGDLSAYMTTRTRDLLTLLYPGHAFD